MPIETSTYHAAKGRVSFSLSRIDALSDDDIESWRQIGDLQDTVSSPLLGYNFARLVSEVRDDLRLIVARDEGKLVACIAVHLRPGGLARPVGAPFDDVSGPLIHPNYNFHLDDMISAVGIHSYRANACIAEVCAKPDLSNAGSSFVIRLDGRTPEDYIESRRKLFAKKFKSFRRLLRKLSNEFGDLEFTWGPPEPERYKQLLEWKSNQLRRTGLLDFTSARYCKLVLDKISQTPAKMDGGFGGFMVELLLNGKLIAGHFGVRDGGHSHPWIAAYDPQFSEFTPGNLLLYRICESMNDMKLDSYNLAGGHDHYKKYYSDREIETCTINLNADSSLGRVQALGYKAWEIAGASDSEATAARMRRRFDHIATSEPGLAGRLYEVGLAFAKRR